MRDKKQTSKQKEDITCKDCIHSLYFVNNTYVCVKYGGFHTSDYHCIRGEIGIKGWKNNHG